MTTELTIIRFYDEPRELVFKAWTDPELLALWWGPDDFTNPVCELDVRPGGTLLIHMQSPDGGINPVTGEYKEVVPPERLVFTTCVSFDGSAEPQVEELKEVDFIDVGGKTKLVLHVTVTRCVPELLDALGGMEEGWNQSLSRLEQFFQSR